MRRHEIAARRQRRGRRDAGRRLGRFGEPEKGEAVAIAQVEEEMLPAPARQVDRLDQRHAQYVAIEFDRLRHILAHQRQMVDAAEFELAVRRCHDPSPFSPRRTLRVPAFPYAVVPITDRDNGQLS
nr:hypothetical protein [Sphingopyxis sp. PET50]